ncbi:MAG: 2-succinyl-6-hydroxy-2,4-cyclohexadiene-1-carboxylate synthase [Acidimicrobiales bacterium]|nr:2-succinyl-6-hydroxy-2,4-cyclohexadiene-1-carboxylate synthase [Acidimicrobiales bacterium]
MGEAKEVTPPVSQIVEPVTGPAVQPAVEGAPVTTPRLARHLIHLSDGHAVGVAVSGRGIPIVVVHGFSAEGFLYAQTLSRLVAMGFKVVAVDTAGHGGTQGLPAGGGDLEAYSGLLGRILDELGIEHAILAGHSMGGRLITDLAAARPERTIAILLLDAIVGDTWDRMVYLFRLAPPLLVGMAVALVADTLNPLPLLKNPQQVAKLFKLVVPSYAAHVVQPWRLLGPAFSILRSGPSTPSLTELGEWEVPVFAFHGEWDLVVPIRTAHDAVRRSNGHMVIIERAGHSWLVKDPETLPAVVSDLMVRELGEACRSALERVGLDPHTADVDQIEAALYRPDAWILGLSPPNVTHAIAERHRRPAFNWVIEGDTAEAV